MVTQAGRTCVSLSFVASRVIYLRLLLAVSIRREIKEAAPRVCSAFMPHHIHMEKKSSKRPSSAFSVLFLAFAENLMDTSAHYCVDSTLLQGTFYLLVGDSYNMDEFLQFSEKEITNRAMAQKGERTMGKKVHRSMLFSFFPSTHLWCYFLTQNESATLCMTCKGEVRD